MAVVKANAYGHGDIEVAKTVVEAGCEYLGVGSVSEGLRLRQAGIKTPILVLGAQLPQRLEIAIENDLDITIFNLDQISLLQNLKPKNRPINLHLKIDTGMNRLGLPHTQIEKGIKLIISSTNFSLKGVYSHFATSDDKDDSYAQLQLERFNNVVNYIRSQIQDAPLFHMANSGALLNFPDSYFDMVRPGIVLYGVPPSNDLCLQWPFRKVLSLRSRILSIKQIGANEPVGYGKKYYAKRATYIGVIPVGYADGFSCKNLNNASILIDNKIYPLVGSICMDMAMVNLGKKLECNIGDEVTFIGKNGDYEISIVDISRRTKTIPYEVMCAISSRVPRIHIYD
jgi:alanine racemase